MIGSLSNLLNPFGYTPSEIAKAGFYCGAGGIISALLMGIFLDRTAMYRKTHITLSFVGLASTVFLSLTVYSEKSLNLSAAF